VKMIAIGQAFSIVKKEADRRMIQFKSSFEREEDDNGNFVSKMNFHFGKGELSFVDKFVPFGQYNKELRAFKKEVKKFFKDHYNK
jgi:hypothetical protein